MPEEHWGYLEAFDRNKEMRTKFGMIPETDKFNLVNDSEGLIEEILQEIPGLIKKVFIEGVNTKQFRDIIDEMFKKLQGNDEILEKIQFLSSNEGNGFSFRNYTLRKKINSDQETWNNDIAKAKEIIETFPTMASWAAEFQERLTKIKDLIERHLGAMK
jgi:hypothetical protein